MGVLLKHEQENYSVYNCNKKREQSEYSFVRDIWGAEIQPGKKNIDHQNGGPQYFKLENIQVFMFLGRSGKYKNRNYSTKSR